MSRHLIMVSQPTKSTGWNWVIPNHKLTYFSVERSANCCALVLSVRFDIFCSNLCELQGVLYVRQNHRIPLGLTWHNGFVFSWFLKVSQIFDQVSEKTKLESLAARSKGHWGHSPSRRRSWKGAKDPTVTEWKFGLSPDSLSTAVSHRLYRSLSSIN